MTLSSCRRTFVPASSLLLVGILSACGSTSSDGAGAGGVGGEGGDGNGNGNGAGGSNSGGKDAGGAGTGGSGAGGISTVGGASFGGTGGTDSGAGGGVAVLPSQPVSPYIVVDQFGYLEDSEKIAVLRDPAVGFDANEGYSPGVTYRIIDARSDEVMLELAPVPWGGGQVHEQSGDLAYWLDFSEVKSPGEYYVLDVDGDVRSDVFTIGPGVYRRVLREALRTFYYQRAGFAKEEPFAEEGWTDGASHIGPGQDTNARLYGATGDTSTERDLSGGWYDAGDYNRYTPWTADYVLVMLRMYTERPEVFGDDLNIPESENGISDLLDEARFGLAHLMRTQSSAGGCVSVLGTDPQYVSASPPSSLDAVAVYGPETTNATIRVGIAFAWAARVFADIDPDFAADMLARASLAWDFAEANPDLTFENSGKVAAGEQQSTADEVQLYKLGLAVSLFQATGDARFLSYFEANYAGAQLQLLTGYNAAWQLQFTEFYLDYATLPDADSEISAELLAAFSDTMDSDANLGMLSQAPDPYLAFVDTYTWGSNAHKSRTGCLFHDLISFDVAPAKAADARIAAERYIHYLHGVNPLGLVYLSNMGRSGAYQSVNTFYHSWYADGSALWDEVGVSSYGPPPGFLTGGPNPYFELDGVCPGDPGCPAQVPSPPAGQPDQKSYLDFNDGWPVNSWSVTENSDGYQVYYLRLLSKFVN